MGYFVFRINYDDPNWLMDEIRRGNLRQGWGVENLQLKEIDGKVVDVETWSKRFIKQAKAVWGEKKGRADAKKRYNILAIMMQMKEDDIVVVPKFPSEDKFLICRVGAGYTFDFKRGNNDYGHVIKLKSFEGSKVFHYASNNAARSVKTMMRSYQSAINNVWKQKLQSTLEELLLLEADESPKGVEFVVAEMLSRASGTIIDLLNELSPKDVESIVERICKGAGFDVEWRNHFDRAGGDADLIITKKTPILHDLTDAAQHIYIQVKKKSKVDHKDVNGVTQLANICETDGDPDAPKILISTVESFTEECIAAAKNENVLLCDGKKLVELLLRYTVID